MLFDEHACSEWACSLNVISLLLTPPCSGFYIECTFSYGALYVFIYSLSISFQCTKKVIQAISKSCKKENEGKSKNFPSTLFLYAVRDSNPGPID